MGKTKSKTLVLGLGNPLMGDDRLGLKLVTDLQNKARFTKQVEFHASVQTGLYLLDELLNFQRVIFVDALVCPDEPAGQVKCWKLPPKMTTTYGSSPHYIGVSSMISIGRRLNLNMPTELWLIGITVNQGVQISEDLSPTIAKRYSKILMRVAELLEAILKGRPPRTCWQPSVKANKTQPV